MSVGSNASRQPAPWEGSTTITGGPSDVDFNLIGGGANPLATLNTGAGTAGLVVTNVFDPPLILEAGDIIVATSDGAATGNSEVTVFAEFRSR